MNLSKRVVEGEMQKMMQAIYLQLAEQVALAWELLPPQSVVIFDSRGRLARAGDHWQGFDGSSNKFIVKGAASGFCTVS